MIDEISARRIALKHRVDDGAHFRLSAFDPNDQCGLEKKAVEAWINRRKKKLATLHEAFAAERTGAVLIILQGMDAAGKDGIIRHVMSGLNPQGARVVSFKQPTPEEREHGYLWRISRATPLLGEVGIFNRSHYEDVLVARVHKERLERRGLSGDPKHDAFWDDRLRDIRHFEAYLQRQGVLLLKFMLHITPEEQRKRLLSRLNRPEKLWKFSASDLKERGFWDRYQSAYAKAIAGSSCPHAPWFVVPSNKKWFSRFVVLEALIDVLERQKPELPEPAPEVVANLAALRKALEGGVAQEKGGVRNPEEVLAAAPGITTSKNNETGKSSK